MKERINIFFYLTFVLIQTLLYELTGFINSSAFQLHRAIEPVTAIDRMIPFLPLTLWTYSLYYLILVFGFVMAYDEDLFPKFFKSVIAISLISDFIFVLIPVEITKPPQVSAEYSFITRSFFSFLTSLDTRENCFPSLHCGHSFVIAFWMARSKKFPVLGWVFVFGAFLVAISTLTLKKHWFVDVIGAAILSYLIIWHFKRKAR